jgi:AmiR/NasT family two-component response regulator
MNRPTLLLIEDCSEWEVGLRRAIQKSNIANESLIACGPTEARALFDDLPLESRRLRPSLVIVHDTGSEEKNLDLMKLIHKSMGPNAPAIVAFLEESHTGKYDSFREAGADSVVFAPQDKRRREDLVCDVLTYWLLMDGGSKRTR